MPSNFRFGRFELRPDERALLSDGEPLRLGGRAFDILLALVERRDRAVEFDELLDVVWPGLAVEENNLSVQISTLRKLLGPEAIATIRGRGYRFTAPTRELMPGETPAAQTPNLPLRPDGAVLAIERGASLLASDDAPGGRLLNRAVDHACIAFERTREGARAALQAQRHGAHAGLVQADVRDRAVGELQEAVRLAQALARAAGAGEIHVTADVVNEFVPGVDGEVEDLGDVDLLGAPLRTYRVRALPNVPATFALSEPVATMLKPSIAILPFEALDANDPEGLLGEALADDVIATLSQSPEFSVISGLSSRRLKRCGLSNADAGACLAATFLLTGSCRSAGAGISVHAQLLDARHGTVLRSLRMEAARHEAFDPVEPLGSRIAQEIGHAVFHQAVQESKSKPLPELDSYALLMGAISLMHRAALREFDRARAMLEHLVQRQGCAGTATAWLAKWHVLRVVQGWSLDPAADARIALDYVQQSLDDDSRDALALSIGGLVHAYLRKDLQTAGQLYEQAISANPSESLAWLFSATRHAWLGQGAEAEAAGERALRLSPLDPLKYFFDSLAATAALANSSFERSVALSQRSLKANCTHASTWRTLAIALVMLNRQDEARVAVQRLLAIEPGLTLGRFRERFPGRDGPLAEPFAEALKVAGVPD